MSKSQIGKTASVVQGQSQGVLPRGGSPAVLQEAAQDGIHCLRACEVALVATTSLDAAVKGLCRWNYVANRLILYRESTPNFPGGPQ